MDMFGGDPRSPVAVRRSPPNQSTLLRTFPLQLAFVAPWFRPTIVV